MDIEKLKKMLTLHEGRMNVIYKDHLGYLTGGIGHLITAKDGKWVLGQSIPDSQIDAWFEKDVQWAISGAISFVPTVWKTLSEERQLVLVDMYFNMGDGLKQFRRLRQAIIDGNYAMAQTSMKESLWAKQVPNRAKYLIEVMGTSKL